MRTKWLLIGVGLLVGAVAIACDDDDENGGDGGGAGELTATLSEMEGSGVTGIATLVPGATQVVVSMEGLPEGPHANHIHHGTCDAQGEVHVTLEELQAGADGGASTVTFDFAEEDPDPEFNHFAAGHYVAVHVGGNDTVGAVISCGNVE